MEEKELAVKEEDEAGKEGRVVVKARGEEGKTRWPRRLQLLDRLVAHVAVEGVDDRAGGRDVMHVERVDHLLHGE